MPLPTEKKGAKQSPSPCSLSVKKLTVGFIGESWLHIVSEQEKKMQFLLISKGSFVSVSTAVHYVPMKNPSSLKLFKLKVKC